MSLFSKSAAVELKELNTTYSALEAEFNSFKEANSAFTVEKEALTNKLTAFETEVAGLKEREAALAAEVLAKSAELETLKGSAKTANEQATLELQKVGQPPVAAVPVVKDATTDEKWETYMAIKDRKQARAYYEKNIKGNK